MDNMVEIISGHLFIKGECVIDVWSIKNITRNPYSGDIVIYDGSNYVYNIPDPNGNILPEVIDEFYKFKKRNISEMN